MALNSPNARQEDFLAHFSGKPLISPDSGKEMEVVGRGAEGLWTEIEARLKMLEGFLKGDENGRPEAALFKSERTTAAASSPRAPGDSAGRSAGNGAASR